MIIYKITNLINGKAYIGQTSRSLKKRFKEHVNCCNSAIGKAIRKYGQENFTAEVIAQCDTVEQANELEQYYIEHFNTITPNGYNLTEGGNVYVPTKETRKKQSEAAKRRFQNQAERDKISAKLTGSIDSNEVKANKSAAQKKRYAENPDACRIQSEGLKRRFANPAERAKQSATMTAYRSEHPFSDETCKKISESKKEYWSEQENRTKQSERAKLREPPSQETRDKISRKLKIYYAKLKQAKDKEDQNA